MIREQTPKTRVKFTLGGEALSPWGHLLHKCHPFPPLTCQRQWYSEKAFPESKIMNKGSGNNG